MRVLCASQVHTEESSPTAALGAGQDPLCKMVKYLSHIAPLAGHQSLILRPALSSQVHTQTHTRTHNGDTTNPLKVQYVNAHHPVLVPICCNVSACECVFASGCIRHIERGKKEAHTSPTPPGKEQFSKNVVEGPYRKSLLSHLHCPTKLW